MWVSNSSGISGVTCKTQANWPQRIILKRWIEYSYACLRSAVSSQANNMTQIIGAPSFFPTVWGWIKKWFDPITTSKIFILSDKDVYPTLSAFIEHESIPKKYGGDLDFECGKLPLLDPPVRAALDLRGSEELFLTAPVRWMDDENGEMMALGVGTVDGHPRKERMATLHSLAMETLTRSSTHQGQQAQAYPDTAQTQSQPAQPAVLDTLHRRSTASSSRPVSRYREQTIVPQHDDLPAKTQPSQPLNSTAADRDSTYSSAQSDDQRHDQYARKASSITEYQSQSHTQPGQPAISGDSDQKPTFLNYRPDGPVQQSNIDLPAQRNPQDDVPSATQPTPPSLSASPPSQPTSPPQELTSPPSQTTTSPVLTKSPAPLADRLNPHSNTSETELAKSLKATSPRGQSMANGKPKQIQMPQRPATLDRTETVYMTPASDPSEIPKQFS